MSYGHADKIAAIAAREITVAADAPPIDPPGSTSKTSDPRPAAPPVDSQLYDRPDVREILARRDIGALFRAVNDTGVPQRTIAELVGMAQSEVSEILSGRKVIAYDVLVRIAKGLRIPLGLMGLGDSESGGYGGEVAEPQEEVDEMAQRRDVLAIGALATLGFVPSFAALLDGSAAPAEVPLPSRLGAADVAEIRNTTEQLRATARLQGGQARAASATAAHCRRLTAVPAAEQVTRSLGSALAELDELAGWCCYDAGLDRHARWHYRTATDLAQRVGDDYRVASALRFAGVVDSRRDCPDDAMKLYQIAGVKLGDLDPDLDAWLNAVSAHDLAVMGHEKAADHLARALDGWSATDAVERADQNYQTALVHHKLGNLETAERFAGAVNGAGRHRPVGTFAGILRATIQVQVGEPGGLGMAKSAVDAVAPLRSQRARERLEPLAAALESRSRSGSDYGELARMARQVSSIRA